MDDFTCVILLNETRKEALYIPEEDVTKEDATEKDAEDDSVYEAFHLTKYLKPYQHLIKSWSFSDIILVYHPKRNISYFTLEKYKELNFITFNKEAHLLMPSECKHV
jgi:hypothetical protein